MRQEYNRLFDKITSERSDKELFEEAIRKAENMKQKKKLGKKAVIIPIAAAMTVIIGGVGVGAAFGFEPLTNLFGGNQSLASEIQSNVFEDSDGHVKITVEQLITDGRYVHAAVHYEALDERGEKWLDGEPFATGVNNSSSMLLNIQCNDFYRGVASYGSFEEKALRTETDRYFYLSSQINTGAWGSNEFLGALNYPMTNGNKTSSIELENIIETKRFYVVGNERSSKYLTPTYLDISPLSYALYAHDDYGLVVHNDLPSGGYHSYATLPYEETKPETWDKEKYLILSDGDKILLSSDSGGYIDDDNYLWGSAEIYDTTNYNWFQRRFDIEFDFDELVGIEIGGVYYDLVAE